MLQGTASFVGKTVLTMGIGRLLAKKGYNVAPFKAQNMSLNSRVVQGNREISWAQYFQATYIGISPSYHMNPVLLKPIGNGRSQVIVHGKPWKIVTYREYYRYHKYLWEAIASSIEALYKEYDFLIVEGAGSPAEINLQEYELVNMRVASYLNAPVLLIGDIERGGVFASLWGTWNLVKNRELIKGFIINKFRGDPDILTPGLKMLEKMTGVPVVGVLPYVKFRFPEEDSQGIEGVLNKKESPVKIVRLPHISNSTDFSVLLFHGIGEYVTSKEELKGARYIIIPGSRNTISDLIWMKKNGLFDEIKKLSSSTMIIGICSGYQMLGEYVEDPYGIENECKKVKGFGFFKGKTILKKEKILKDVKEAIVSQSIEYLGLKEGDKIKGYEIHHGISRFSDGKEVFFSDPCLGRVKENIFGTYLHGLFENTKIINGISSFLNIPIPETLPFEKDVAKLEKILKNYLDWNRIDPLLC